MMVRSSEPRLSDLNAGTWLQSYASPRVDEHDGRHEAGLSGLPSPNYATYESPRHESLRLSQDEILNKDSTRPPLLRTWTTTVKTHLSDGWWWDFGSWLVSFCCVVTIVSLLASYNGKPQPEKLSLGLTINAYIAIFSGLGKAALILPTSEAIGQLKWLWFRREKKLQDFCQLDYATRGPWGSMMLLGKTKFRELVSMGAVITILALAFEPFFQQIVTYPVRIVPKWGETAYVTVATQYMQIISPGGAFTWSTMDSAINSRLSLGNEPPRSFPTQCPTGNCTFPDYSSLGVCHQCADVSYLLEYQCNDNKTFLDDATAGYIVRNPCGYKFNKTFVAGTKTADEKPMTVPMTILIGGGFEGREPDFAEMTMSNVWNATVFTNLTFPILHFYVAYTPGGPVETRKNTTAVLKECAVNWCVKKFSGSFEGGKIKEREYDSVIYNPSTPPTRYDLPSWPEVNMTVGNTTFTVPNGTTDRMELNFFNHLPSLRSIELGGDEVPAEEQLFGLWSFMYKAPYDINPGLTELTTEMTSAMRDQSSNRRNTTRKVYGTVFGPETYVHVRWIWMTLPVVLLFSGLAFLFAAVVQSRKAGIEVRKNSALASMLYGMTAETRLRFEAVEKPSEIEEVAKGVSVRLEDGIGQRRLVSM